MKKYIHIISIATLALLAVTACQKEEQFDGPAAGGNMLSFSANTGNSLNSNAPATKSAYVGEMQLTNDQGETVNVTISVLDGIESGPDQMRETKGYQISSNAHFDLLTNGKIGVYGFLENTSTTWVGAETYTVDGAASLAYDSAHTNTDGYTTHWKTESKTYYWPKAGNLDFWAWAPKSTIEEALDSSTGVSITNLTISNASTPKVMQFTYDLGTGTDATAMPDLLFAASLGVNKKNNTTVNNACVPLPLQHALAAVQFKIKSKDGGTVTDIKLVDVVKSGSCVFNGTTFAWTSGSDDPATYSHNFSTTLAADTLTDFSGNDQQATFMMIPQDLGSQKIAVLLDIPFKGGKALYTGTIPTSTTLSNWEAGKTYIYTIVIDEDVNINIDDEVSNENVKSNVIITNTGTAKAYIRAAIVANWVDANGKLINAVWTPDNGAWTATINGTSKSTTSSALGDGWTLGTDGYYYYKYQVPGGAPTVRALFDSYKPTPLTGTDVATKNAHLEMNIVVQAIQANMLLQTDGKTFKTDSYGWETTSLSTAVDAASNFTTSSN